MAQKQSVQPSERRAYTIPEYCAAYRMSRSHTYKMMARGKLRTVLIGGKRLVPVEAAAELMNGDAQ
jgi:hypothetical protein